MIINNPANFILLVLIALLVIWLVRHPAWRKPKTLPLRVGTFKIVSGRGYWQSNPFHLGAQFRQKQLRRTSRSFSSSRRYSSFRTW